MIFIQASKKVGYPLVEVFAIEVVEVFFDVGGGRPFGDERILLYSAPRLQTHRRGTQKGLQPQRGDLRDQHTHRPSKPSSRVAG